MGNLVIRHFAGWASIIVALFPSAATAAKSGSFPWQMTSYKYAYLTSLQKQIYLGAYFETRGYIIYGHTASDNPTALKELNGWGECVLKTRKDHSASGWSPNLPWALGDDVDKSVAYVLDRYIAPRICKGYAARAGTERRVLQLYTYSDWKRWSLKDKSVYLAGFLDTEGSYQEILKADKYPNHLRDLAITIEATGIDGILSDVLETKFDPHQPLPWSVARGLGRAHSRVRSMP